MYGEDFYLNNINFIKILVEAITNCKTADDFKNEISCYLTKITAQYNDIVNYDYSKEIIEYIYKNY
jgi:hypothetical protein